MRKDIEDYTKRIYDICSKETCYGLVKEKWSEQNKFWGHCAMVTLLIYDRFGGKIKKGLIKEENLSHYWNEIDGKDFDATLCQYNYKPTIVDVKVADISKIKNNLNTTERYSKFKKLLGED